MKKTMISAGRVALREVAARWVLLPAAILVGALAMFVVHSIDHVRGDADGVMTGTWVATLVVSIIVGLSLLGHELTNGRLSFYFARPFTPAAIFSGKLAAGIALALVIQAAIITLVGLGLPALAWQDSALAERGIAVVGERILATAVCTLVGMAASIVLGSKTRWLVLDLVCIAAIGVISTWVALYIRDRRLSSMRAESYEHLATFLQVAALAVAVLGLAVATARALARGRTDRTRAHAALSTTLWPIAVPAACALLVATISIL